MKKTKKLLAALMTVCLMVSVLGGCGSTGEKSEEKEAAQETEEKKVVVQAQGAEKLTFWGWVPYNNVVQPMTEAFQKNNPGIEVEVQVMDWGAYWDKLTLDLSNGEGPDIFVMNLDNYAKYKDYMEPLDELSAKVNGDGWKDKFSSNMLDSTYVEDQLKIFPASFGGQWYVYYNKTMLDELGMAVPKNYTELAEYAGNLPQEQISLIFGGKEALNMAYLYLWLVNNREPGIVGKAAKGEVAFDSEPFLKGFGDLQRMMEDGVIPKTSFGIDPTTDQDALFKSGKSPMVLTGAWQSGAYLAGNQLQDSDIQNDEIGVFPMYTPANDSPYVVGALDHGWAINKNSKNKEAAMKLITEWSVGEGAKIWLEELYGIPCASDITLDMSTLPSEEAKKTIDIISDTLDQKLVGPRSTGNAVVDNKTGEAVQAFVQGMMDAETAAAEIQKAYESSK